MNRDSLPYRSSARPWVWMAPALSASTWTVLVVPATFQRKVSPVFAVLIDVDFEFGRLAPPPFVEAFSLRPENCVNGAAAEFERNRYRPPAVGGLVLKLESFFC